MAVSHTFTTSPEVLTILNGRAIIAAPSYQKQWTSSRLVVMEDGTTIPLLYFLAAHKFGAFDPKDTMPFWADKRFTNESLENVSITKLSSERRPRKNTYGVPSGTPEYLKRYRDANKDRVKKYHQTYYRKMRSAYLAAQSAEPSTTPILDNSFAKLLEILPVSPDEPKE